MPLLDILINCGYIFTGEDGLSERYRFGLPEDGNSIAATNDDEYILDSIFNYIRGDTDVPGCAFVMSTATIDEDQIIIEFPDHVIYGSVGDDASFSIERDSITVIGDSEDSLNSQIADIVQTLEIKYLYSYDPDEDDDIEDDDDINEDDELLSDYDEEDDEYADNDGFE